MTCILTDEELQQIAMQSIIPMAAWQSIANAAARKALEMAARELQEKADALTGDKNYADVYYEASADAIRELAGRFE